jgi:hypothetical protein
MQVLPTWQVVVEPQALEEGPGATLVPGVLRAWTRWRPSCSWQRGARWGHTCSQHLCSALAPQCGHLRGRKILTNRFMVVMGWPSVLVRRDAECACWMGTVPP